MSTVLFRAVLALAGFFAVFSGLDQALGGLFTLGWMGQSAAFEVTAPEAFQVIDNHQRFLGGVWTGIGLTLWVGLVDPLRFRQTLTVLFSLVFLGGLSRFSQLDPTVLLEPDVGWALVVELVGMPLLALWLARLDTPKR